MVFVLSPPPTVVLFDKSPRSRGCYFPEGRRRRRSSLTLPLRLRASSDDDRDEPKLEYTPWLIAGLGNPGTKFHGTRHNVGFEMIDRISQSAGVPMNVIQSKALLGIGSIEDVPVILAKPQTYVNFCGESVGALAAYYGVPLRHILLVYDEMSLPNGVLRFQPKGGHGHHSGVKSVMAHLERRSFARLCIGIGNPPGTMDMKAFLLQKFSSVERKQVDAALDQAIDGVRNLLLCGFDQNIEKFNLGQKYKYHKTPSTQRLQGDHSPESMPLTKRITMPRSEFGAAQEIVVSDSRLICGQHQSISQQMWYNGLEL